ncbi:MAG: cobalamin biosynthesis protein CobD [Epulopiscium sp.]|nr:cobalamin biosynthesis protein CobD [Candidatus Epulonipiscium sp.]
MTKIWVALGMDLLLGDPYWFPHPVRGIGAYIQWMEKLIRKKVSTSKGEKIAGIFLLGTTVGLTYGISFFLLKILHQRNAWAYSIGECFLLWTCFAARCLQKESMKVYHALQAKDLKKSRYLLSYIVGRDTENLSEQEILRATVETILENTSDGVIAPLFYMFLGGAPLALAYKAINTLDSMVGYQNEKYKNLGWASAKVDDVVNYLPARWTGVLFVLVAFFLRYDGVSSFHIMKRDGKKHASPNSGYPEAAGAGALRIQLGGSSQYFGKKIEKPTLGEAHRLLENQDIKRANKMMYGSLILAIACLSVLHHIF